MRVVIAGRGEGKTDSMIVAAAFHKSYIVCPNYEDAQRIFQRAQELKENIRFPISWREFIMGRYYAKGVDNFIIDDLDRCIQSMTDVEIKVVSLTDAT